MRARHNQQGIGHLLLIVLLIVVLGGIAGIGYVVMNKTKEKTAETALNTAAKAVAKAECTKLNDKDLCKFYSSWEISKKYRMVSTGPDGAKSTIEIDGDNTRFAVTGETPYEYVIIGGDTYTKAGSTWYKQSKAATTPDTTTDTDYKVDFDEPTDDTSTPDKTKYTKVGKEACGSLTCFKYEVVDPTAEAGSKEFIWFDDKDYQLRRVQSVTKEGTSETTFEYSNVSVKTPSPVKELGPNQYIIPGQSEPATMPSAADFQ
jgi:outer membrane lipoprotein-sorting protein